MRKECFAPGFVDAPQFRECAACPISKECDRAAYLRDARGAAIAGQVAGLLAGLAGVAIAAARLPEAPAASGFLLALCLLYIAAVLHAGKRSAIQNREERDALARRAEENG